MFNYRTAENSSRGQDIWREVPREWGRPRRGLQEGIIKTTMKTIFICEQQSTTMATVNALSVLPILAMKHIKVDHAVQYIEHG